ncbi:Rieske 2Fe-2S domain-containing protein [Seohaeicola saemankumensis]|nr:Rieske 2Fe-2S domain-containing protein [Seohaeicola saemankumensis]MCA0871518.1 Rieske 2Fe-2S domain-containing protein [Seohaeicola saemankumensis]
MGDPATSAAPDTAARFLCRLSDIPDGQSRGFDPDGTGRDTMFVVRMGNTLFGYQNNCPHYDRARMAWKKDQYLNADGTRIQCAAHGALFRIEDGVCELGPCLGKTLARIPLLIRSGLVCIAQIADLTEPGDSPPTR